MGALRERLIGAGLLGFRLTRLHRVLAPLTRGHGAVLAFHHVRPTESRPFAPNRGLEITPDDLDAVLGHLRERAIPVVPLDAVPARLAGGAARPFAVLTFDDGYRDTLQYALPVLERHAAPFTVFVTTGFADRTARLWWLELEDAIRRADELDVMLDGSAVRFATHGAAGKARAFAVLAARLRRSPPAVVGAVLDALGCDPGESARRVARLCLDWDGIGRLAAHPLATVGCHTLSHPCLAALDAAAARREMAAARDAIARRLDRPVRHLAYPYGGMAAAGPREFALAAELGFAIAVTTRPGVLGERQSMAALPRLSVNGRWPSPAVLDVLLSGAPFAMRDLVRRQG